MSKPARITVILAAAALSIAGCTSGTGKTGKNAAGLIPVKVGVLITATNAPIFVGADKGFFKDQGIDIKLVPLTSGSTSVAGVLGGSYQFAYIGTSSLLTARSKGVPVKLVVNGGSSTNAPILVRSNSSIKKIQDLRGKRIGVSSLGSLPEFTTVGALWQAGVKRNEVKLLEVPLPQGTQALDRGDIDAVWSTPPFSTTALKTGHYRSIGSAISGKLTGLGNAAYIASERYLKTNHSTAEAFAKAVTESNNYASTHPDEMVAKVPSFTKIKPGVLKPADVVSTFGPLNLDRLQEVNDFMRQFGFLTSSVDVKASVWNLSWTTTDGGKPR